ncbi:DgyrCDS11723 [Dimorphilus gyrociliatus]|uniref:DgyrCDS11723 n=1 Tax=Dimorphilus gyrociliatus TaxID=2664684 RepID=A0A7I8W4A3_9ANNE|nr:DgyrCDS11723 [Dimorphilus gyrociliatus]
MTTLTSDWNDDNVDEGSKRIVGEVQLRKYGLFLEDYAGQLQEIEDALGDHIGNNWDEILDPIGLNWSPVEHISLISLVQTDNKVLNKVVTVLAAMCGEIDFLVKEAEKKFYNTLLVYGEGKHESDDGEAQIQMGRMIPFLQELSSFIKRCYDIMKYTLQQIGALYNGARVSVMTVSAVHFQLVFEHVGSLLRCLITLDEIIESQTILKDHWVLYIRMIKSIKRNPSEFKVEIRNVKPFDKLLSNLESCIFSGTIFTTAISQCFDSNGINVTKNTAFMEEFTGVLKALSQTIEAKLGKSVETDQRLKLVELAGLYALYYELYRQPEKKAFKLIWDAYKLIPSVTLVANVSWYPNEFLLLKIPDLQKIIDKKAKLAVVTSRQNWLQNKLQTLPKEIQALRAQLSAWIVKMNNETEATQNNPLASKLDQKYLLFTQGLVFIWLMNNLARDIINIFVNLQKSIPKQCIIQLCRLFEMIQAAKAMFHRRNMLLSQVGNHMIQHFTYIALTVLVDAKQSFVSDKKYTEQRLDVVSSIVLAENVLKGTPSKQRRDIAKLALSVACRMRVFKEEYYPAIETALHKIKMLVELTDRIKQGSDCSYLYWHCDFLNTYFQDMFEQATAVHNIHYMFGSLSDCVLPLKSAKHVEDPNSLLKLYEKSVINYLEENLMKKVCSAIETDLRLQTHLHLQLDDMNPFRVGLKDLSVFVRLMPIRFMDRLISIKTYVEHYLNTTFYNLTTIALHDWKTYADMKNLAYQRYNLNLIETYLPSQTLEQGLDVLEIMRNIHVFVSSYAYNLNNQIFVEKNSNNKHLNTINIRHIANSIRTHGTGIMNTTINFTYQFLRKKFFTFSQFMYDEHIKSRLIKDWRYFKENHLNNDQTYPFERAEKFNKGIRKLGLSKDGLSYLDQFRLLITQIGNAMGYIRMIRSGGLHCCSSAISFIPDLEDIVNFEEFVKEDNLSTETQKAAKIVDVVIENLTKNFSEGTEYFKMLVDVFAPEFRSTKNKHLSNFFVIVPPLALNYVENSISCKEKLSKKNKEGAAFTDDGFAMGVAYILKLLNQYSEFDSLHWFSGVRSKYTQEKQQIQEKLRTGKIEESLKQTYTLTLKRLDVYQQEFDLLYYSHSSARIFFGADMDKDEKKMPLFISGREYSETTVESISAFYEEYSSLRKAADEFTSQDQFVVKPNNLLYVCQAEYATIIPNEQIKFVGSSDATTCHIFTIRHTGSGITGFSHLDGNSTKKIINILISSVSNLSKGYPDGRLECYIVGGFLDGTNSSANLSMSIIDSLSKSTENIYLELCAVTPLNDCIKDEIHYPIVYGAFVDLKSGKIMPATFQNKEPDIDLRTAKHFKVHTPANIYNTETGEMIIDPFSWSTDDSLIRVLSWPKKCIRRYLSTSPNQELPDFEDHILRGVKILLKSPNEIFPNQQSRKYQMVNDLWKLQD